MPLWGCRITGGCSGLLLADCPLLPCSLLRVTWCHSLRPEPAPGPGAHGEAAADRHHHHHHRALHHPAAGRGNHAPHQARGHRGLQTPQEEQEGCQPEQDREDGWFGVFMQGITAVCWGFFFSLNIFHA